MQSEISLDFDHSVGTEDRFAIRRFLNDFCEAINNRGKDEVAEFLDESMMAEGFGEFGLQKQQFVEMIYKKFFGRRHNYVTFEKMKLTSAKFLFHLRGEYEEYQEGILSAAGSIELVLVKHDNEFRIAGIKFFPRMRISEDA